MSAPDKNRKTESFLTELRRGGLRTYTLDPLVANACACANVVPIKINWPSHDS